MNKVIDITSSLTSAASSIQTQLTSAVGVALPLAAAILGVFLVWKVFKRLTGR